MRDFKKIHAWERAHQLALNVYRATQGFPREEIYALTSQIRRACTSIPTNIAEGCGRQSEAELNRFFEIALGSANELEYQLLLSRDLKYLDEKQFAALTGEVNEIKKMLIAYANKLKASR